MRHADHTGALRSLPLVVLYLTERCNSRCISCDYWRHGREDMTPERVAKLLPWFREFGTHTILISGGEPLVNPHWSEIAAMLSEADLKLWLLTSGLALAKHAPQIAKRFAAVTVSMDGADRQTYAEIRGVDGFDKVCEGVRAAVGAGCPASLRVTVQRANYRQLPACVDLAHRLGVRHISFLAADVSNPQAFGRAGGFSHAIALQAADLPQLEQVMAELELSHAEDFHSGFIAETPAKLRRILEFYAAVEHLGPYPPVRCNAPEFSVVIGAGGRVQPCFFISAPCGAGAVPDLDAAVNGSDMRALREAIRQGKRKECRTCVCSAWRDLDVNSAVANSADAPFTI